MNLRDQFLLTHDHYIKPSNKLNTIIHNRKLDINLWSLSVTTDSRERKDKYLTFWVSFEVRGFNICVASPY